MGISENELDVITIKVRDPEHNLVRMIDYIRELSNPGHSFEVVVDPYSREDKKEFDMDGDGSFSIKEIKLNGKKFEDENKLNEILNILQIED